MSVWQKQHQRKMSPEAQRHITVSFRKGTSESQGESSSSPAPPAGCKIHRNREEACQSSEYICHSHFPNLIHLTEAYKGNHAVLLKLPLLGPAAAEHKPTPLWSAARCCSRANTSSTISEKGCVI